MEQPVRLVTKFVVRNNQSVSGLSVLRNTDDLEKHGAFDDATTQMIKQIANEHEEKEAFGDLVSKLGVAAACHSTIGLSPPCVIANMSILNVFEYVQRHGGSSVPMTFKIGLFYEKKPPRTLCVDIVALAALKATDCAISTENGSLPEWAKLEHGCNMSACDLICASSKCAEKKNKTRETDNYIYSVCVDHMFNQIKDPDSAVDAVAVYIMVIWRHTTGLIPPYVFSTLSIRSKKEDKHDTRVMSYYVLSALVRNRQQTPLISKDSRISAKKRSRAEANADDEVKWVEELLHPATQFMIRPVVSGFHANVSRAGKVCEFDADGFYPSLFVDYHVDSFCGAPPAATARCNGVISSLPEWFLAMIELRRAMKQGHPLLAKMIKGIMNPLFGAFGNPEFYFYDPNVVNLVMENGKKRMVEVLKAIVREKDGTDDCAFTCSPLYGQTDSVFVAICPLPAARSEPWDTDRIHQRAQAIASHVTELIKGTFRLKCEHVFHSLWFKGNVMNNYAAHVAFPVPSADNEFVHRGIVTRLSALTDDTRDVLVYFVNRMLTIAEEDAKSNECSSFWDTNQGLEETRATRAAREICKKLDSVPLHVRHAFDRLFSSLEHASEFVGYLTKLGVSATAGANEFIKFFNESNNSIISRNATRFDQSDGGDETLRGSLPLELFLETMHKRRKTSSTQAHVGEFERAMDILDDQTTREMSRHVAASCNIQISSFPPLVCPTCGAKWTSFQIGIRSVVGMINRLKRVAHRVCNDSDPIAAADSAGVCLCTTERDMTQDGAIFEELVQKTPTEYRPALAVNIPLAITLCVNIGASDPFERALTIARSISQPFGDTAISMTNACIDANSFFKDSNSYN